MQVVSPGQITHQVLVDLEFKLGCHNVIPIKYLSALDLRKLFNDGRYTELVAHGVLSEKLIREGPPSANANQPPGTKSQVLAYLNSDGRQVAIVHQYLRPDGSLGGGGKPAPKKLLQESVLYILDEKL